MKVPMNAKLVITAKEQILNSRGTGHIQKDRVLTTPSKKELQRKNENKHKPWKYDF